MTFRTKVLCMLSCAWSFSLQTNSTAPTNCSLSFYSFNYYVIGFQKNPKQNQTFYRFGKMDRYDIPYIGLYGTILLSSYHGNQVMTCRFIFRQKSTHIRKSFQKQKRNKRHFVDLETSPFKGVFDLVEILQASLLST